MINDGSELDKEIPIFTQDRNYVERFVYNNEEKNPNNITSSPFFVMLK